MAIIAIQCDGAEIEVVSLSEDIIRPEGEEVAWIPQIQCSFQAEPEFWVDEVRGFVHATGVLPREVRQQRLVESRKILVYFWRVGRESGAAEMETSMLLAL